MPFRQEPPRLGNQYETDPALRSYLRRVLPPLHAASRAPPSTSSPTPTPQTRPRSYRSDLDFI